MKRFSWLAAYMPGEIDTFKLQVSNLALVLIFAYLLVHLRGWELPLREQIGLSLVAGYVSLGLQLPFVLWYNNRQFLKTMKATTALVGINGDLLLTRGLTLRAVFNWILVVPFGIFGGVTLWSSTSGTILTNLISFAVALLLGLLAIVFGALYSYNQVNAKLILRNRF